MPEGAERTICLSGRDCRGVLNRLGKSLQSIDAGNEDIREEIGRKSEEIGDRKSGTDYELKKFPVVDLSVRDFLPRFPGLIIRA